MEYVFFILRSISDTIGYAVLHVTFEVSRADRQSEVKRLAAAARAGQPHGFEMDLSAPEGHRRITCPD